MIEINKRWCGVPMSAVELYLTMCLNCTTDKKISKKAKKNSLKMILSTGVGHRVEVDLIERPSLENPVPGIITSSGMLIASLPMVMLMVMVDPQKADLQPWQLKQ